MSDSPVPPLLMLKRCKFTRCLHKKAFSILRNSYSQHTARHSVRDVQGTCRKDSPQWPPFYCSSMERYTNPGGQLPILASHWLRAPSAGSQQVVRVMFLQSCPGCMRTSNHRSVHGFGCLRILMMLFARLYIGKVHISTERQNLFSTLIQKYQYFM